MDAELQVFLTPQEVADALRLSVRTITGGLCRKTLPWIKVGGSLRMRKEDLLTHLRSNENELVLEKRPKVLGLRIPIQEATLPRLGISNEESSGPRRSRRARAIEKWEIQNSDSDVS